MNGKYNKEFAALSDNIIYYRKLYGYTQQQLADKAGITRSTLAKMENGQNRGTIETLLSLSELFNVSIDTLLTNKEEKMKFDIERKVQRDFIIFCRETGISPENAVTVYIKKVVREKRFPFDISL